VPRQFSALEAASHTNFSNHNFWFEERSILIQAINWNVGQSWPGCYNCQGLTPLPECAMIEARLAEACALVITAKLGAGAKDTVSLLISRLLQTVSSPVQMAEIPQ
jgi:hypothetical protein